MPRDIESPLYIYALEPICTYTFFSSLQQNSERGLRAAKDGPQYYTPTLARTTTRVENIGEPKNKPCLWTNMRKWPHTDLFSILQA